jgi:crossover junction endodeoxyribonuclease RuvC
MQSDILLAVDPGKTGAVAAFENGILRMVHDPVDGSLTRRFADLLCDCLDFRHRTTVVIEKVNGVPGQSGPASFNFGYGAGALYGVCIGLGVDPVLIPAQTWKWKMGLRGADKLASLEMARGLWPTKDWFRRAKDDGRAEAALLGLHWLKEHRQ